ncbi:helix-turn-helix domain-containing protein [Streptomyces sp. NRRL S-340]|uniref:helix-turn-helix transcriptional regulator n=1 Tax=Streptomyces sp. NRRL S-340 TaxID=1463901 RepID=UPI000567F203
MSERRRNPRRREVLEVLRSAPGPLGAAEAAERIGVHPNTVRFHLDALVAEGLAERRTEDTDGSGRRRPGPGRPRTVYAARPGMDRGGARGYGLLARMLLGELASRGPEARTAAVETGRAWGRRLAKPPLPPPPLSRPDTPPLPSATRPTAADPVGTDPVGTGAVAARPAAVGSAAAEPLDRLVGLLDDLGFDPAPEGGGQDGMPERIRLRHCPFLELAEEYGHLVCPLHLGLMQGASAELDAPLTASGLEPFATPDSCLAHLAAPAAAGAHAG